MNASDNRVLYYHADASALGGHLTHPSEAALHTQASVSLSQAGGHADSRVETFKHQSIVQSGPAYSQVTGSIEKSTRNWKTVVTSTIENVDIKGVVTADKIVSKLTIEHPRDGDYPKVDFTGCKFTNLCINGIPIEPVLDLTLLSDGFPDEPWPAVKSFVQKAVNQNHAITTAADVPPWLKARYDWMESPAGRTRKGCIQCSIVSGVHSAEKNASFGHVILVPGFGNIFLGELLVYPASINLTMLRVELAGTTQGHLSLGNVRGNGSTMP